MKSQMHTKTKVLELTPKITYNIMSNTLFLVLVHRNIKTLLDSRSHKHEKYRECWMGTGLGNIGKRKMYWEISKKHRNIVCDPNYL